MPSSALLDGSNPSIHAFKLARCSCSGEGLAQAVAGRRAGFGVDAADAFGNARAERRGRGRRARRQDRRRPQRGAPSRGTCRTWGAAATRCPWQLNPYIHTPYIPTP